MFSKLNNIGVKNVKLYREAVTDVEDAMNTIEDANADLTDETNQEIEDTDINEDDMYQDDNYDDNEFNFDDPTFDEDTEDTDSSYNADDESGDENMFNEDEDMESAQFKRKVRLLNRAFVELYDKYTSVVTKLKEKDVAGDRGIVVKKFIDEYSTLLTTLRDYLNNNDDEFVVRFQVFVEFRAAFVTINNKLNTVEKDTALLS